ncbi:MULTISPECIES: tail fiber protein [Aquimarina]|uniref:tail fiber protein n=1 Tax=Aquimarina TaxID=290174 RepID=UPI000943BACF|nr:MULTISPECIES: tail fiber protein [Aquimarina]
MKKNIFLSVSFVLVSLISTAQNNTFPTTGNVGIGTTTPDQALVVNGSISFDYGNANSYNGFRLKGGVKTEYYNIITGGTGVIHEFTGSLGAIMSLANDGKVGIGTTAPSSSVDILKNNATLFVRDPRDASGADATLRLQTGGQVQRFKFIWNDRFIIDSGDGTNEQFTIKRNGNIGIGTAAPDSKLAVNGKIHAKEVKVDLTGWPDYVFENNYNLPSLQEVEHHIVEEGHLPNIPSASDVEKNGIQLGEMNAKLLQKIEELTLYMIAQNKKTEQLQKEIELLKQKNIKLEKKIK